MNVQNEIKRDVTKANGKFQEAARAGDKSVSTVTGDVVAKGQEIVEMAQEQATDLFNSGSKYLKSSSSRAMKLAKDYPVQTAIGGLALGLLLGSLIFGAKKAVAKS